MAETVTEPDYDKPVPVEMDDEDITSEGIISKASRNVPKRPVQPRIRKSRMLPSPFFRGQGRSGIVNINGFSAMESSSSPLNCIALTGCLDAGLQLLKHGLLFQPVSGQYKQNIIIHIVNCHFAVLRQAGVSAENFCQCK